MTTTLIGASNWEQDLFGHFQAHLEDEQEMIDMYRDFATRVPHPAMQFLAALLLDEEEQHHRLCKKLAKSLEMSSELSRDAPPVPRLAFAGCSEEERKDMLYLTERFLEREEKDQRDLDKLAKELDPVKKTTLWQLLTKAMRMDSQKHTEILRFVRNQLLHPVV